eukprot:355908-Rhodomonas_salina.1
MLNPSPLCVSAGRATSQGCQCENNLPARASFTTTASESESEHHRVVRPRGLSASALSRAVS